MAPTLRKGRRVRSVKIYTPAAGEWRERTTGTRDAATAKKMQHMVDELGPRGMRAFDLLDAVLDGRLTVARLWDEWVRAGRRVDVIRARLADLDVAPLVQTWVDALKGSVAEDTREHYAHSVRTLLPLGAVFPRSELTSAALQRWVDELPHGPGTKRKYGAAMSGFCSWLVRRGVLERNPMRDVALPPPGRPRVHFLETPEAVRLAEAQPSPFREFSALLAGTGVDVSVALGIRRRDVDLTNREIRAPGTKAHARDRIVRVADWAWPYVERMARGLTPDVLLFREIPDRWEPGDVHRLAIDGGDLSAWGGAAEWAGLVKQFPIYRGYTMRDSRHTYAVRAVRAGTPYELVARQLGHANAVLVARVYGRFAPTQRERDHWEKVASAMDETRASEATQERAG